MIHAILKPYVEYINSTMNGLLKETNKIKKMFPYKVRVQCPCCSKIIQGITQIQLNLTAACMSLKVINIINSVRRKYGKKEI